MRSERRILVNTGTFTAGEVVGQLANFAFVAGFARAFGIDYLAQYSIGMSIGALLAMFVDLGSVALVTREASRKRGRARMLIGVLLPLQIPLALLLWAVGVSVGVWMLGPRAGAVVLACTCGYQILLCLSSLVLAPFIGVEQVGWSALGSSAHRVLALMLGALAIFAGAGPGVTAGALVASAVALMLAALAAFARRFGAPRWRAAPRAAARLLYGRMAFFGLRMLNVVYSRGGLIILSLLASHEAVGTFTVADRIMVAPSLLPMMFVNAVYPALSRLANVSVDDVLALTVRCGRLLLVGAITLATLVTLLAPDIVALLFGKSFAPAAAVLQVLAWTLPVSGTRQLLSVHLLALDQRTSLVRARAVSLGVFLASCPLLIVSGLGYKGPAWAQLLSEMFEVSWYLWLLHRSRSASGLIRAMLAPLLAAATTIVVASVFLSPLPELPRLIALFLVMVAALLISGSVRLHDLRFLRQILAPKQ
jgi:PST family polysaccharide transporter